MAETANEKSWAIFSNDKKILQDDEPEDYTCKNCHESDFIVDEANFTVCRQCGFINTEILNNNQMQVSDYEFATNYDTFSKENQYRGYIRKVYLNKIFRMIEGNFSTISLEDINRIKKSWQGKKKKHYTIKTFLRILKKLQLTRYKPEIFYIIHKIDPTFSLPVFSYDFIRDVKNFLYTAENLLKRREDKKKIISIQFIIRLILLILDEYFLGLNYDPKKYLTYFFTLKTKKIRRTTIEFFKQILSVDIFKKIFYYYRAKENVLFLCISENIWLNC